MTAPAADEVRALLAQIVDPNHGENLVAAGCVRGVGVDGDRVAVEIVLGYPVGSWGAQFAAQIEQTLEADPRIARAVVDLRWQVIAHKVQQGLTPLPEVKNILAVASGKGGVGKSTTAANLALALRAQGATVGILDADIYGPSQPRMLGVSGKPDTRDGKLIVPKSAHGVQVMSIGFMIEEDTPMIWRGPMVTQALQQLLNETDWQGLDYLVIDLPPGTGDIQLTLCQRVPVSGAVIVTTPQDIALLDARKGLRMFEKVAVPVLGVIENMSTHVCSNCGHEEPIFGSGGGERMAEQYGVPLLGRLPLDIRIREESDSGHPTVIAQPDSAIAASYHEIARQVAARLSRQARNKAIGFPNIVIQST
ncbi:MAG: iron-sulfur cluster carrier protein ApbC [Xanthomonadales bacterium]|nr:Iron-sulfur cluster carrier protein [Xanthomonadales bacterium]MCC6593056.1 iron-sulfur cluster carrier protein ApbC [Xanthomonadales bacterium]MCE7930360.1 iron-sulfur cluster carrier protein ApbC [Xanthomonadales bacterium PRO6]